MTKKHMLYKFKYQSLEDYLARLSEELPYLYDEKRDYQFEYNAERYSKNANQEYLKILKKKIEILDLKIKVKSRLIVKHGYENKINNLASKI